jgi:hypothetical protein
MGEEARGRQAQPSAEVENDYLSAIDRNRKADKLGVGRNFEEQLPIKRLGDDAPSNMPIKPKKMRQKFDRPTRNFPKGI